MTETTTAATAEAAALTVRLPEGRSACAICGTSSADDGLGDHRMIYGNSPAGRPLRDVRVELSRCPDCTARRALAVELVEAHPRLAAALGRERAEDGCEGMLAALRLIGQPVPDSSITDANLGVLVRHLATSGLALAHRSVAIPGVAAAHPFALVPEADIDSLRRAYSRALAERVARSAPAVRLSPPALPTGTSPGAVQIGTGCLVCGVSAVAMSAQQVHRLGGRDAASASVWQRLSTTAAALGASGPESVAGFACRECSDAIDEEGAVGPSAIERALVQHLAPDLAGKLGYGLPQLDGAVGHGALVVKALKTGRPLPEPGQRRWSHIGDQAALADSIRSALGS